jgi:hypothetical protein
MRVRLTHTFDLLARADLEPSATDFGVSVVVNEPGETIYQFLIKER